MLGPTQILMHIDIIMQTTRSETELAYSHELLLIFIYENNGF